MGVLASAALLAAQGASAALTVAFQPIGTGSSQTQTGGVISPGLSPAGSPGALCAADPGGGNYIPGCDFSAADNVVRTHDEVIYQVNVNSTGGDPNPIVKIVLPVDASNPYATPGYVPVAYPGYDQSADTTGNQFVMFEGTTETNQNGEYAGGLGPGTYAGAQPGPNGIGPGTSTAVICPGPGTAFDTATMTLTCDLTGSPNISAGGYSYTFPLKLMVMGSARNSVAAGAAATVPATGCTGVGAPVAACTGPDIVLSATAQNGTGGAPTAAVASTPIHVSATPRFDVNKYPQPYYNTAFGNFGPNGEPGWFIEFQVGLYSDIWLGSEALMPNSTYALADSLTVPAPIDPQTMQWMNYSVAGITPGTAGTNATNTGCLQGGGNAAAGDFGPVKHTLGNLGGFWGVIRQFVGNGGACDLFGFAKSGTSGGSLSNGFTITNPDTRLDRRGQWRGGDEIPFSGETSYASNKSLFYFIPAQTWDTATYGQCLPFGNSITAPAPQLISVSGQTNIETVPVTNNSGSISICQTSGSAGGATKSFINGGPAPDWAQPIYYNPSSASPVDQITPGQLVYSRVSAYGISTGTGGEQVVTYACDAIDNSIFGVSYISRMGADATNLPASGLQSTPSLSGPYLQVGVATMITALNQPWFNSGSDAIGGAANTWSTTSLLATAGATGTNTLCDPLNDATSGITWYNVQDGEPAANQVPAVDLNKIVIVRHISAPTSGGPYDYGINTILKSNTVFAWPYTEVDAGGNVTATHAQGDSISTLPPGTLLPNHAAYGANTAPLGGVSETPYAGQPVVRTYAQLKIASPTINAQVGKSPTNTNIAAGAAGTVLTYTITPAVTTDNVTFPVTITVTDVLDPNQAYVPGSTLGTYNGTPLAEPSQSALPGGYTQLVWTFQSVPAYWPNSLPTFTYQASLAATLTSGTQLVNDVKIEAPYNPNGQVCDAWSVALGFYQSANGGGCYASAHTINTFIAAAGFRAGKTTSTPVLARNAPVAYALTYTQDSDDVNTSIELIDILPWNGDGAGNAGLNQQPRSPATNYAGTFTLQLPVNPPGNDATAVVWYSAAAPATIDNNPFAASNGAGGSTPWCTFTAPSTWTLASGTGACPTGDTTSNNVSAIRLVNVTAAKNTLYEVDLSLATNGNLFNDIYDNQFCVISGGGSLVCPVVATAAVAPATLSGLVYRDDNANGMQDAGELGIAGVAVGLTCENATPPGGTTIRTTTTDADGAYTFTLLDGGTCTITETQPADYKSSVNTAGSLGGTVGALGGATETISAIALPTGGAGSGYTFGERQLLPLALDKTVAGVAAYSGTFNFGIDCGADNVGGMPYTSSIVLTGATTGAIAQAALVPTGASCSVSETLPLPSPPQYYDWDASNTPPAPVSVTIEQGGANRASFTNTLERQSGTLVVTKHVVGPAAGVAGVNGTFTFTAECGADDVGGVPYSASATVSGGADAATAAVTIPAGASCTVTEDAIAVTAPANYDWSTTVPPSYSPANPLMIAGNATPTAVTVTNTLERLSGGLAITKTIAGPGANLSGGSFGFSVDCGTDGTFSGTASVAAGTATGSTTITPIPTGASCTVSESSLAGPPSGYLWSGVPGFSPSATVAIPNGSNAAVEVTNTLAAQPPGTITVQKNIVGGPIPGGTFDITVTCTRSDAPYSQTQPVAGGASIVFADVPTPNTCTVAESATLPAAPANYAWDTTITPPTAQTVTLTDGGSASVTVVNTLKRQTSTLTINKLIAGGPSGGVTGTFTFSADCGVDNAGGVPYAASIALANATSGSTAIGNVPAGAMCSVAEAAPAQASAPTGYQWGTTPVAQNVTVAADGSSSASFVNALTRLDPPFHLIKTVTGGPAGGVSGTFAFTIDCGAVGTFTQSITLANATSGSVAIADIPFGTSCTFSEASSLPTAPSGFNWGALPANQTKTVDGTDVNFVNTLSAAPPVAPASVPALRAWTLALLALLMVGAAPLSRRRQGCITGK